MVRKTRSLGKRARIAALVVLATGVSGCVWDGRQFREAALPMIETGASAILNGVLDGLFAAIEVETPNE